MSDAATKPEQTVIAVDAPRLPELISSEPISSPAEEGAEATPAPKADEAAEAAEEKKEAEPVKEEKPEPKEISQGTLSKTHGGLLSYVTPLLVPPPPTPAC